MLKKRTISLILMSVIMLVCLGTMAQADDIIPVLPTLKLSVEISPLAIFPPIVIYTAQLSYVPPSTGTVLKCDFYNINPDGPSAAGDYLGSAIFSNTGTAVLSKQMKPGKYIAIAKTIIRDIVITSNKVEYIVP